MAHVTRQLAKQNFVSSAMEEAFDLLAQLGYDSIYGARPLKRVIQKRILNELCKEILAEK